MKSLKFAALCLALAPLAGCVAPTGPVGFNKAGSNGNKHKT